MRIAQVLFTPEVQEKLWWRHGLTQWEVEDVIFSPDSEARWDVDPVHGGRLIVRGATGEREPRILYVALRSVDLDEGTWACITAFEPSDERYGEDR